MDDLLEETGDNAPAMSVAELSGAINRLVEGGFARVRVRGEVGRVVQARSGHLYFDLKEEGAVLAAVSWRGQAARLSLKPEEGMEVVATGRLTTFPGQSKYQLIVEEVTAAGVGALMAMLEARRQKLAAEGLFDAARKRPLPFLPEVIGVVTSPTGAVIRDILHRLRERFPRHVLVWPVAVQGERCAPEVAAAIRGFNALAPGGRVPRPDLIIVARGGGSVEDLWGFNDEAVVRAAAESAIPLISAVGHETDTTLIDHAADRRAPTPTAAAEMAVPVRADLSVRVAELEARRLRAISVLGERRSQRLSDLARGLPRPADLVDRRAQALDAAALRLPGALRTTAARAAQMLARAGAPLRPRLVQGAVESKGARLQEVARGLERSLAETMRERLRTLRNQRLDAAPISREMMRKEVQLQSTASRFARSASAVLEQRTARLSAAAQLHEALGYRATLRRGYVVARAAGDVVTRAEGLAPGVLELEFHDGRIEVQHPPGTSQPRRKAAPSAPGSQGSLF
ncbi:MAG: exodeoxyribonuclease VII large subunit [Rhodobacteraceae bacterium]|nr:exodeoxyribonuclease VII large subunit [Paracoccaceae bacterium]